MELGFEVSIFFSMHCFSTAEKPALSAVLAHLSQEFRRLRYRPDYACHAFPRQSHTGGRTRTRRLRHREPRRQHPENSPKCSICDDSQRFTARSFGPLHHFKRRFNSAILRSSRRSRAAGRYQRIRVGGCAKQSRRQLSETCGGPSLLVPFYHDLRLLPVQEKTAWSTLASRNPPPRPLHNRRRRLRYPQ